MTRINLVPAAELSDKHLLAEYRELPRVFGLARSWHLRGRDSEIPSTYRMGTGHVTFFYDKLGFLLHRQKMIVKECVARGFSIMYDNPDDMVVDIPKNLMNDYHPTAAAVRINRDRIRKRS